MGNTSKAVEWNVKFVQNMDDQNFGNIDIYKNEEGKYIMMLKRTFMKDDKNQYKDYGFHEILKSAQQQASSRQFFTPIIYTSTKIENLCILYEVIETYCEYFNFTLADMIKHKKQMDRDELWMCFYWLTKLAIWMKQKQWIMQDGISLRKIFITLKGMINISIHHLMKASTNDVVLQHERTLMEEVGLSMLQLICMAQINENENLELYLRKAEKIDSYLGEILGNILRKSIKGRAKPSQKDILDQIERLLYEDKIEIAKQIKINKFKYVIAKPEINTATITQQSQKQKESLAKEKPIVINSLQGRKNHETMSLRDSSSKRTNSDIFQNNFLPEQKLPIKISTPLNKALSTKGALLMDQIQNKKRETQKQREKLIERKELIMKMGTKNPMNKENYLGNSIREVRPSYNRKQSWSRKVMNEQLKNSNRK